LQESFKAIKTVRISKFIWQRVPGCRPGQRDKKPDSSTWYDINLSKLHRVSKKTSKIIFVITTSNFHQICQFLAQRRKIV